MIVLPDGDKRDADRIVLIVTPDIAGQRLDKAFMKVVGSQHPGLSRSRIATLIACGAATKQDGTTVSTSSLKVKSGQRFTLAIPETIDPVPQPQSIALDLVFEDDDLLVVNKPAGMVVHPAPGAQDGTLVNALLAHCGDSLTGIGGERRPGIVHRIDKLTTGLLVVAKTQAAHAGLSKLFAQHTIERKYLAICWGCPNRQAHGVLGLNGIAFTNETSLHLDTLIARHPQDRKRMAVAEHDGRRAITDLRVIEQLGDPEHPFASLLECQLETGRTHQIRVHAAHAGHPLVGDPIYGETRTPPLRFSTAQEREALATFPRQALHAAVLGFDHPITGAKMAFSAPFPADMQRLLSILRRTS